MVYQNMFRVKSRETLDLIFFTVLIQKSRKKVKVLYHLQPTAYHLPPTAYQIPNTTYHLPLEKLNNQRNPFPWEQAYFLDQTSQEIIGSDEFAVLQKLLLPGLLIKLYCQTPDFQWHPSQKKKSGWLYFWRVVRLSLSESWDSPGQAPPDPLVKIIPNDSKWLNMAQNCSKLLIITQNCSKLHQIARNASKWLRIAQHGSKWLQRAPEGSGALRMAPNRSKLLQIEK